MLLPFIALGNLLNLEKNASDDYKSTTAKQTEFNYFQKSSLDLTLIESKICRSNCIKQILLYIIMKSIH